ncbi:haloacid dehalogenase-like hydrolase [Erysipelothrix piscisicarius]|uniref:Haloacid dehalogenase-like hydrolase n=1 Tax=Erysipelothrix piscisicarius TaxID=2485784 RepID=A0A3S5HK41_9FIRM|nr:haloacid dehalogenase-like hydrolase [Erysipelothrix piscisicarius]AZK43742.1 haloacid dehalogenase-like hydrolase [Erysipelothrix piscisicarius]
MSKRILDCNASDFLTMDGTTLKNAIKAAEGRTICSENVVFGSVQGGITNAEVAKAFGADLILLNGFDTLKPFIEGLGDCEPHETIRKLKKLVGRPIGVNLEPGDFKAAMLESQGVIAEGRMCSEKTLKAAENLGFDFICLTGNPGTGVTNREIEKAIQSARTHFSGMIIAGKMHGAGVDESVVPNEATLKSFCDAGADVILMPAVGTVPGFTDEELISAIKVVHNNKGLVLTAIGTSQEGSSKSVIENIAIRNKIAGADIQHIGDAGYGGLALVENIFALSVAIRGIRHTTTIMSRSINR